VVRSGSPIAQDPRCTVDGEDILIKTAPGVVLFGSKRRHEVSLSS
jgi:hypothetical protein